MSDIVWSINPEKDKTHDLVIRMREFAIPLLEANNIVFDFTVAGNEEYPLPMNLRRTLFLIFKETIYNILKHAKASQVTIRLEIVQGKIVLKIEDNGQGFSTDIVSNRNGLKNIYSRAHSVGGTMQIDSSPSGTVLEFTAMVR